MDWIDVNDRLPEMRKGVLCAVEKAYKDGTVITYVRQGFRDDSLTHIVDENQFLMYPFGGERTI